VIKLRFAVLCAALAGAVAAAALLIAAPGTPSARTACLRTRSAGDADSSTGRSANPLYVGPGAPQSGCADRPGLPESFADLAAADSSRASRSVAPGTQLRGGAYRAAVTSARDLPSTGAGTWQPYGDTPLQGNNTDYDVTNGSTLEGLPGLSGRTSAITTDDKGNLYAATSNGGIWESTDHAATWKSIGDPLPTQVVSGVAWTSAAGGTVIALTGDDAYGGDSVAGMGIYYTRDGGATWTHASGVPDGVLGFQLAVDPNDPNKVYAGTGAGLFRSTDGGASWVNENLPTGKGATPDCSGQPVTAKDCFLANMVTSVVVEGPKNANTTGGTPGAVMAAVGWRAGNKPNADGSIQSPGNGIYVSKTGAPGSFTNMDMATNSIPTTDPLTQARIGRIGLGIANGADQNHQIVYAIVEDAVKFNGGVVGLDANENGTTSAAQSDVFNAVWASTDFGTTWHELEGANTIDNDTSSGSALAPPTCKTPAVIAYCPGVQAWYNLWVLPDPTRSTAAGVPTRLLFGLEEIWANNPTFTSPNGLDGNGPAKFDVIGRYYGNAACTILNATQGLPVCPADLANSGQTPTTTTHPDQHGHLFVPDGKGGVTFVSGNDGGVFTQHTDGTSDFSQGGWGNGNNSGLHTLQPYDAEMAKDGTVYMGLQDNGEGKIEPSGKSYTVFGGDGFFTAVNPDDSNTAYEEYVDGAIAVTTDGGKNWTSIAPSNLTSSLFATPFQMDPNDAAHLMIGGRQVFETTSGPGTTASTWSQPYDLGTAQHSGDASATATATDPDNQLSAVDVVGIPPVTNPRTGPPTKNIAYTSGSTTAPGPGNDITGVDEPQAEDDHKFTIGPNDGDQSMTVSVGWNDPTGANDWDVYLYKVASDGTMTLAGSSASSANPEKFTIPHPASGNYLLRVYNYTATGTFDAKITFSGPELAQNNAPTFPSSAYVGFCGFCDVITQGLPFGRGIATNVGGSKPGMAGSADGWHVAAAKGLPVRYITSIRMDPANPSTVYATLAGYGRKWAQPGALGDDTSKVGTGHVFKSTDAGASFTDVTGDLPDVPANWSILRNGHLIVGTDVGVFESCDTSGGSYFRLGSGLPTAPISTLRFKPGDPDLLVAATYGRGVYTYRFSGADPVCPRSGSSGSVAGASHGTRCAAAAAARAITARPIAARRRLRLGLPRSRHATNVDVFQVAHGRRVYREQLIARFRHKSGSFTWNGRATIRHRKATDGYYFARVKAPGEPISRVVLQRAHGRWKVRPDFFLRGTCGVLTFAKIERPVFGGVRRFPLRYAYRTGRSANVAVSVFRGKRLVHRFKTRRTVKGHTYRIALGPRHLKKGDYHVVTQVTSASQRIAVILVSRLI
jgi:hypothetical protein